MGARFASQLVHELAHQVNASAADPNLSGIHVRNGGQIKSGTFVDQPNFNSIGHEPTLEKKRRPGAVVMGMTDDVARGFIDGEHDSVGDGGLQPTGLTNGFHKQPSHWQQSELARHGQGKGKCIRHTFPGGGC